jgi:hypothetical protein
MKGNKMRLILLGAAALLLAGCGGEEYPVPASQAFATLSSVGTPEGLYPLPVGVEEVSVNFESDPSDNSVRWKFSHAGDDLATMTARVKPSGDNSSNVSLEYAEGTAPDENWHNGKIRRLLKNQVQQLVIEAVDSKFDGRPFSSALRNSVSAATATATVGKMMDDVDASLDAEIARRDADDREEETRAATNPANATKPMMDLSKYN